MKKKVILDALQVERCFDGIITANPKRYFAEHGNFNPITSLTYEEAYAIAEVTIIETALGAHKPNQDEK
jgi:hypothetical protein